MGGDLGKVAALGALGMTGLGLAGVGPMAGLLGGGSAAGAGLVGAEDMAAGLLPASELGAMGVSPMAMSDMGFSGMNLLKGTGGWLNNALSSATADPKNAMKMGEMGVGMMNKGQQKPQQQMPSMAPVSLGRGESAPMGAKTYQDALAANRPSLNPIVPRSTSSAFGKKTQPENTDMEAYLTTLMDGPGNIKRRTGMNWYPA